MNLFTSDLFTPAMAESRATSTPRSYSAPAFARRYGRVSVPAAPAASMVPLTACTMEAFGGACVQCEYDLAA